MKPLQTLKSFILLLCTCMAISACHKKNEPGPYLQTPTAQWARINALPADKIVKLATANNGIYAASGTGNVYMSADNGSTWTTASLGPGIDITALSVFNNEAYVGTYNNGIFASDDNGKTFINQANIAQVTSFAVYNNKLYSSSENNADIFVLNENDDTWSAF